MDVRSQSLIDFNELPFGKKPDKTKYLHQPPTIKPNLGKSAKKSVLPPTHVCKVILYDNTMQRRSLDVLRRYYDHQQYRFRGVFEKNRHAFADREQTRQKLHEGWTARYTSMKEAYISRYGTENMPTAEEEEAEEYAVFTYAKLATPINVLCYFLASGNDPRQKEREKKIRLKKQLQNLARDPLGEYLKRRLHPVGKLPPVDPNRNKICSQDPRFHSLTESLIKPSEQTDGYLQLSPGYAKLTPGTKRRALKVRPHQVTLPPFYAKHMVAREDSQCSETSREERNSSMGIYEDERTSVSSLT